MEMVMIRVKGMDSNQEELIHEINHVVHDLVSFCGVLDVLLEWRDLVHLKQ
jgi:hypothetical protein